MSTNCIAFLETYECTQEDRQAAFTSEKAQFKKVVFDNIDNYTALKDFISRNQDTLAAWQNKKCKSIRVNIEGKNDTLPCKKHNFSFYDYGKGNMIKDQIPDFLYPELKEIYSHFNKDNFNVVFFDIDGTVSIRINSNREFNDKNVAIIHELEWTNRKYMPYDTSFERDTLLRNGAKYKVSIDCYRGW